MASCIQNICTKNYQNLIIVFPVTVENVGDAFLAHNVVSFGGVTVRRRTDDREVVGSTPV